MITEKDLAIRLGLSRPVMRSMRAALLSTPAHWFHRDEDKAVVLTAAGVSVIEAAIAEKNGAPLEMGDDPAVAPDGFGGAAPFASEPEKNAPLIIAAQVVQWRFKNRRIVEATILEPAELAGDKVMVRVADNGKFREGMSLKAIMDRPGFATLKGRGPRFVGRW